MRVVTKTGAVCLVSLSLVGCGRKNPVQEITLSDSGVAVSEQIDVSIDTADWNAWRGPAGNGVVPEQNVPTHWDEITNVRWRTEIPGRGHSSPIVVDDSIYLATADDSIEEQSVHCLARDDGSPRWKTVVHQGAFPTHGELHAKATNANGTIACDGEYLYIAMLNSDAVIATALDLDGNIVWQQEIGKFVSRFGYAPSPVLYKSLVIFAADNSGGGYLAALDSKTGRIAWRTKRPAVSSYSSPTVATVGGADQLLISGCDSVTSYDPAGGTERWKTPCLAEATCGTIVASEDFIYAAGGYPETETVCLSPAGDLIWSNSTRVYEPSLVLCGQSLIAVNDDGVAFCWSAQTGEQRWKKRFGGNFSASPIVCGDTVWVSNLRGQTFVFRPEPNYVEVAKNRIGDDCYASPAVSNGQLFLRIGVRVDNERREEIVCIESADPETEQARSQSNTTSTAHVATASIGDGDGS